MTTFIWIIACIVCFFLGGIAGAVFMDWITTPDEEDMDDNGYTI